MIVGTKEVVGAGAIAYALVSSGACGHLRVKKPCWWCALCAVERVASFVGGLFGA